MINNKQQLFNRLIRLCKTNKDGFTASQKAELLNFKHGYAVSLTNNKDKCLNKLVNNAIALSKSFHNLKGLCFGGWFDNDKKEFYLDISLIDNNKNYALHIAKLFNQKAIFSFNNFQSIMVK